jgi:hypothetical protein
MKKYAPNAKVVKGCEHFDDLCFIHQQNSFNELIALSHFTISWLALL